MYIIKILVYNSSIMEDWNLEGTYCLSPNHMFCINTVRLYGSFLGNLLWT